MILDRMAIEEAGPRPEAFAEAIHAQIRGGFVRGFGPVDVHGIAGALDILRIASEPLDNLEGALITQPERTDGIILTNANSSRRRQRFTVAHELLHFLNVEHVQTAEGFRCRSDDFSTRFDGACAPTSRHQRQEAEANRFAIELLAPAPRVRQMTSDQPHLHEVLALARDLDISREAAARRYIELHPAPVAILYSHAGRLRYAAVSATCPPIRLRSGQAMPPSPNVGSTGSVSEIKEVDPRKWFARRGGPSAFVQTLSQRDTYAITLIAVEPPTPNRLRGKSELTS